MENAENTREAIELKSYGGALRGAGGMPAELENPLILCLISDVGILCLACPGTGSRLSQLLNPQRDHPLWAGEHAWLEHTAPQTLVVRELLKELGALGAGICLLLAHWDFLFLRKWASMLSCINQTTCGRT